MASGLQIWDAAGHLIVDTTTRMGRIVDCFTYSGGDVTRYSDILSQGEFFFVFCPHNNAQWAKPTASVGSNYVTFNAGGDIGTIMWGVF